MTTTIINYEIKTALDSEAAGTHLHGYITANYSDLKKLLGNPSNGDDYKSDAEWVIKINNKVITIYNYKDGKNYNGAKGMAKTKITDWHIGAATDIKEEMAFLANKLNATFRNCY